MIKTALAFTLFALVLHSTISPLSEPQTEVFYSKLIKENFNIGDRRVPGDRRRRCRGDRRS